MFFRACRHHSTKSAKWGTFDTVCPLVCKWGQLPLCPPSAPPPMQMKCWNEHPSHERWKSFMPLVNSHVDNVLVKIAPDLNQPCFTSSMISTSVW